MPINHDLHRLSGKIEALKEASTFSKPAMAEGVLVELVRVLHGFEARLQELQK